CWYLLRDISYILSQSSCVNTYSDNSDTSFTLKIYFKMSDLNSDIETLLSRYSEILATRLRIDLIPFDSIFSFLTFKAETTFSISESNITVQILNICPFVEDCALPEIFLSSIIKLFRTNSSAGTFIWFNA